VQSGSLLLAVLQASQQGVCGGLPHHALPFFGICLLHCSLTESVVGPVAQHAACGFIHAVYLVNFSPADESGGCHCCFKEESIGQIVQDLLITSTYWQLFCDFDNYCYILYLPCCTYCTCERDIWG
jgi:hypothetical protein